MARNLWLLANVYWKEFASPANLFDAWGGAYDLIYQDAQKRFRHLDSYTIFIRHFNAALPDSEIELINVLKYERRPSASVIAMTGGEQLDWFAAKDITASDAPVSLRVGGKDFTMDSTAHITILTVGVGNRYLAPIIQIDGLDPKGRATPTVFTDFDEEGRLCVAFQAKHDPSETRRLAHGTGHILLSATRAPPRVTTRRGRTQPLTEPRTEKSPAHPAEGPIRRVW